MTESQEGNTAEFNFEEFTGRYAPVILEPVVSMQVRGHLSLNKIAFEQLGSPKKVVVLYDRQKNVLGLRATDKDVLHAYPVRAVAIGGSTYVVSSGAAIHYFGIDTTNIRYKSYLSDGVLIVDLNQPLTKPQPQKNKRTNKSAIHQPE